VISPVCQSELKASIAVVKAGSDIVPRFVLTTAQRGTVVLMCQWHENVGAQVAAFDWLRDFFSWLDVFEFVFSIEMIEPKAAAVMRIVRNIDDCEIMVQPIRPSVGTIGNVIELGPERIDPAILALLPRATSEISAARMKDLEMFEDALDAATTNYNAPLLALCFGNDGKPEVVFG
jgi:hypothetical protein